MTIEKGLLEIFVPVGFFFTPLEGNLNVWHITEKKMMKLCKITRRIKTVL
jgi:hypothetical protein